jgi:hypothetical protein
MNVANHQVVVSGPVVSVHLRFVGIDVVGECDTPSLSFQGEPDKPNPRKKLRGGESSRSDCSISVDRKSISTVAESFKSQFIPGADAVVFEEAANPFPAAEEIPGCAGFCIRTNIGADALVQAVKHYLNLTVKRIAALARWADAIGREKIAQVGDI